MNTFSFDDMLDTVRAYIKKYSLLDKQSLYLVALSGGADSVCLLLMMRQLGYAVHAVHCNFHLRGEESERDEFFCKNLCERLGVQFHFTHFDTLAYADLHGVSIEMAARNLRYAYFEQLRESIGAADILVAHHRDDNVETVLLNFIRGTGMRGLAGMRPRNGRIVRPLLCLSRKDIECYLDAVGQDYVTDSTNLHDDVKRNKLRLNVIPLLEQISPAANECIARSADLVAETVKIVDVATRQEMEQCVNKEGNTIHINIEILKQQPSPEYLLFAILHPLGFHSAQVMDIYEGVDAQSGKVYKTKNYMLITDRGELIIEPICFENICVKIPEEGTYRIDEKFVVRISTEQRLPTFKPSKEANMVTLDADKVKFPLVLRNIDNGDRFMPYGMCGTKLVSDYLTDKKYNLFQRRRQKVLVDASGEIVWLLKERVSQKVAVTDNTINVLTVRYVNDEE